MEILNRKTAKQYYSDPLLGNMLNAVFNKYKGQNGVRGNALFTVQSQAEAERLQDYYGYRVKKLINSGVNLEVHLKIFAEELEEGYKLTIPDLYEVLYSEQLLTKSEQKDLKLSAWTNLFVEVEQEFINTFNVSPIDMDEFIHRIFNWFQRLKNAESKGYMVLRNSFDKGADAYSDLFICISALWHLFMRKEEMFKIRGISTGKIRLPTFAAHVTEDSHAFDKKKTAGRLLWHALYDIELQRLKWNSDEKNDSTVVPDYLFERQIYRDFDILDDDLSSISHVFVPNLIKGTSPRTLNLREIEEMKQFPKYTSLYIIENPSIISYLVDETIHFLNINKVSLEKLPLDFPVLICTIGQSRVASKIFIEKCLASNPNCVIYYSGDLDVPGIQMLDGMKKQFSAQFYVWRMDPFIYRKYVSSKSKPLSEADLNFLKRDEGGLKKEMRQLGAKVYQELFGKELKEDYLKVINEVL